MFSDNGGEFESSEFKDMCENFNIKVVTTPAEAPWSNGICERHNHILTETLLKIKKDVNFSWEIALVWAISAKNSLINISRFSPYQLVLGRNVSLPSVFSDKIPALEGLRRVQLFCNSSWQNLLKKLGEPYEDKPGRHRTCTLQVRKCIIKERINLDGGDKARLLDRMVQLSSFGMEVSMLRHIYVECSRQKNTHQLVPEKKRTRKLMRKQKIEDI